MDAQLKELLQRDDEDIDLAEAALLLARCEYPSLDPQPYLRKLRALAAELADRIEPDADIAERILALNHFLFVEQGFAPNIENFYDPRNSFLNDVIDRRLGIPITLAVIYIEIGTHVGLPLVGVSFPGRFLVKLPLEKGDIVLDPSANGRPLSEGELLERLRPLYDDVAPAAISLEPFLVDARKKDILLRMLRNLKAIHLHKRKLDQALVMLDDILELAPAQAQEVRERGEVYEQLECFRAAAEDYERYLALQPGASDVLDIRERLIGLKTQTARLN